MNVATLLFGEVTQQHVMTESRCVSVNDKKLIRKGQTFTAVFPLFSQSCRTYTLRGGRQLAPGTSYAGQVLLKTAQTGGSLMSPNLAEYFFDSVDVLIKCLRCVQVQQ